ncbi:MAG: Asp-tRNA(Asn)/Glu-tRNA(Gln) amidotransferase subunit GatA [Fimbriimonadaceae bacterium]|nr:Asp-tRNA(Asn)/Glu-tRNA(Gln) amidotransferase subunit GatA [Fimbriimonadaceae bacterium]
MSLPITASALAEGLRTRQFSAIEVAQHFLQQIEVRDGELGCFLTVEPERTLAQAQMAQDMLDRGEGGPLTGVPIALKDNLITHGQRTTAASKILETYIPPFDGDVAEALVSGGIPVLGKTNLDEFAMGTSTENSAYQVTRNPWDTKTSPGGSSGGSAASVAGGLAPISLGSDTGGSIRQPASLTGTVGFKPTYGRVSRYGLIAFASSLDQIGPFGLTVEDVALAAQAIMRHDHRDSTSLLDAALKPDAFKTRSVKGLRFALPSETMGEETEPGVRTVIESTVARLRAEGAEVDEVSLPSLNLGITTYYIIAPAEASSNLARFDGIRYGPRADAAGADAIISATRGQRFGHEVKLRIMVGTYALSAGYFDAYYVRAQQMRAKMAAEIDALWSKYDAVISPTSPCVAFPIGEIDSMSLKLMDFCTIPANMGGYPAISLPAGLSKGLPVGVQLMGPVMGDEGVLSAARGLEQLLDLNPMRPPNV